jgi:hypothetical protein
MPEQELLASTPCHILPSADSLASTDSLFLHPFLYAHTHHTHPVCCTR